MRKQVVVLGAGFFALSALTATYDSFLPLLLRNFISNLAVIGFLMTVDNYVALVFQPWWGSRSDGTRTHLGRRVPYLLVGMSLTALFAAFVPFAAQLSLQLLIGAMIALNLAVSVWRAPLVALLADLFPPAARSTASGITQFAGALGGAAVLLGGSLLFGSKGYAPFVLVSIALLGAALIIARKLREPVHAPHEPRRHDLFVPLKALRGLAARPHKDPLLFLAGALCFQLAMNGALPYFTLYVRELFSLTPGQAGTLASGLWIGVLVATLPAGLAGARYGQRRVMLTSLLALSAVLFLLPFVKTPLLVGALWGVAGVFSSAVVVNSIILFLSFAGDQEIGLFTGLHLFTSAAAQIVGPPVWGLAMQLFGPQALWVSSGCAAVLATFLVSRVREGGLPDTELMAKPLASPEPTPDR
ncbi:MAG: MFS transporter [Anaerolineae bacterium]|nr:MFS transporter [Anaerolineae bacterium]